VRDLGHYPTQAELKMYRQRTEGFPDPKVFYNKFGPKQLQIEALRSYCDRAERPEVLDLLPPAAPWTEDSVRDEGDDPNIGFVYLMKAGRYYKIGRTNAIGRREYEPSIQLPEKLETVHAIETDDVVGIERYWHERFADRRANGEWFSLTKPDVAAFKRRRRFM